MRLSQLSRLANDASVGRAGAPLTATVGSAILPDLLLSSLLLLLVFLAHVGSKTLRALQSLVDGSGAHDGGRDLLRYLRSQFRELGDVDVLNAGVGHRIDGRVVHVRVSDGVKGQLSEAAGYLLVLGQRVGRLSSAGRHVVPAEFLADQLDVVLR